MKSFNQQNAHQNPILHYILIGIVLATLIISIVSLINTIQLKRAIIPPTIDINDFLQKLTAHQEMKSYVGIAPLNIVQINDNNLASIQSQINGVDISHLGDFIVQYTDKIIIYDYNNDKVKSSFDFQQEIKWPQDFFAKLNKHPEMKGLEKEQPIGGQIDAASLTSLKQQFPDIYSNAKVGDYLLRYKTKLVVYDYKSDKIVKTIDLTQ